MFSISVLVLYLATAIVPAHAQYSVLYSFGSHSGDPDGLTYPGIIAQGRDGSLYTTAAGADGLGSVFKITPNHKFLTVLHRFSGPDGKGPVSGLTLGTDGNFYGTTQSGGLYSFGTVFKMTPAGAVTTLYSFKGGIDSSNPYAPPIEGLDGNFYGVTRGQDVSTDYGSVYKLTPSGAFTTLYSFTGSDGADPIGPLVQATDGYFYGTTYAGGTNGGGVVFRISSAGNFKILFNFDGVHGSNPYGPLTQGSDGNFYGVTSVGGTWANYYPCEQSGLCGVAFTMMPTGAVTVLCNFGMGAWEWDNGLNEVGGLVQATDGYLYGTNAQGGDVWEHENNTSGVLFQIDPSTPTDWVSILHLFYADGGWSPVVTLLQHTNGLLYGITSGGGAGGNGTFFSFGIGSGPHATFLPAARQVGHTVEILGQGLTGTSAVSFNGTPATTFDVYADTYMTAIVPQGATTGFITVTTPSGTLTSNKKFQVKPQITSFSPSSGAPGTEVVITGVSLAQTSKITFNSVVATNFTINSDTEVTVTVPVGSPTTKIGLTTTGAPVYSATAFAVTP